MMNERTPAAMISDKPYVPVVTVAKMIRADLKAAFPGVQFSVRSRSYAGGASIDVSWTDGPADRAVKAVVGGYAAIESYNVDDSANYRRGPFHSGAHHVFTSRKLSDRADNAIARRMLQKYGYDVAIDDGFPSGASVDSAVRIMVADVRASMSIAPNGVIFFAKA